MWKKFPNYLLTFIFWRQLLSFSTVLSWRFHEFLSKVTFLTTDDFHEFLNPNQSKLVTSWSKWKLTFFLTLHHLFRIPILLLNYLNTGAVMFFRKLQINCTECSLVLWFIKVFHFWHLIFESFQNLFTNWFTDNDYWQSNFLSSQPLTTVKLTCSL